jgi:hypothetical protein
MAQLQTFPIARASAVAVQRTSLIDGLRKMEWCCPVEESPSDAWSAAGAKTTRDAPNRLFKRTQDNILIIFKM